MALAVAIRDVKKNVRHCRACGNLTESSETCGICCDERRDRGAICVVEFPRDVAAIEKTGKFRGLYHVLMGRLSPIDGVEPEHLNLKGLVARAGRAGIREIILATSPTVEGDATARYIRDALKDKEIRITRLARGLPAGTEIEFAGRGILEDALEGRREMKG